MPVKPWQIIGRGLRLRCPNCGGATLFAHWLKMHEYCARCGLQFEYGEGFFLGALTVNYFVTGSLVVVIVIAAIVHLISVPLAMALAVVTAIGFPVLFYPAAKSLWLMTWYATFPRELPANRAGKVDEL